jgi:hypothetical protein
MIADEFFGRGRVSPEAGTWAVPRGVHVAGFFALSISDAGTANAAVTTTDTTLTDTRKSWPLDDIWIGARVSCDGQSMLITDSNSNTVTGSGWSGGGNPGNGKAWTITTDAIQLPDATKLEPGYIVYCLNMSAVAAPLDIVDNTGVVLFPALAAVKPALAILAVAGSQAGTWITRTDGNAIGAGAVIPTGYEIFEIDIDADTQDYDVRAAVDALGYTGNNPALVTIRVKSGYVVSSSAITVPAMATGRFPTQSSIFLEVEDGAWIIARGGNGGAGGVNGVSDAGNGGDGGLALKLDTPTRIIVNGSHARYCRVSGGAGGGGGGAQCESLGVVGDGGGGGGAPSHGTGGSSQDGSPGGDAFRDDVWGWKKGGPGGKESGTDAGNGGFSFSWAQPGGSGTSGGNSPSDTGGSGGSDGDAINYTMPYIVIGDSDLRIMGSKVAKMAADGNLSLAGAGTLGDG